MKYLIEICTLLVIGLLINPLVMADDEVSDDDSMTVVEDSETSDAIIVLPESAAESARENAAFGIETANSARALGREFGQQMAESAKSGMVAEEVRNGFVEEQRNAARGRGKGPGGD
ncbi:MAG: hypothetical protein OEZ23_00750 [Gammaproteobacteria bacterium]|nr:hypothetical protein [Gammaproteobacteria bacterium]